MLRNGVVVGADGSSLPSGATIEGDTKVEYIPLEYAQKKINKLVTDYTTLKSHYDEHITQLNDFHMKTNSEMKDYYENFIKDLKKKALDHLTIVKKQKENLEHKLTEELKAKEVAIENLRDVIAEKNNEYQESMKKLKAQHNILDEEARVAAKKERDALIAKFHSTAFVSEIVTKVEMDNLRKNKLEKVQALVSEYEEKVSEAVMGSKEKIDTITAEYQTSQRSREECYKSLQSVLFSVESNYASNISEQFEDYYDSLKFRELKYKSDMSGRVSELLEALEETKKEKDEFSQELAKVQEGRTLAQLALEGATATNEKFTAEQQAWNAERENLSVAMEAALLQHQEANDRLAAQYEASAKDLKRQILHLSAAAETASVLGGGVHKAALRSTVDDMSKEHVRLTDELCRKYDFKIQALRSELQVLEDRSRGTHAAVGDDASRGMVEGLQQDHAELTAALVRSYEQKMERLRSDVSDLTSKQETVAIDAQASVVSAAALQQSSSTPSQPTHSTPIVMHTEGENDVADGMVAASALTLQKRENKALQEKISALEKKLEELTHMPSRRFPTSIPNEKKASVRKMEDVSEVKEGTTEGVAVETGVAAPLVTVEDEGAQEDLDAAPVFSEDEANRVIEELEEEIYNLRLEMANIVTENADNASERKSLGEQLELLIKEKRTDIVAKYEEDIKTFRNDLLTNKELIANLKEEKQKNDMKIKELRDRSEKAEKELKERDDREIAKLNPHEETTVLKTTVSQQREDIIMKSKAATAGWDAAASADKRLDIDVEKAYQKGLTEADNRHSFAMTALNESLEKKETRITELLVSLAAADKAKKDAEAKLAEATEQLALKSRGFGGYNEDGEVEVSAAELQEARDNLDLAQEEVVEMATRIEALNAAMEMAHKKIAIFEKLVSSSRSHGGRPSTADGTAMGVTGGTELRDVINSIKAAVVEGTKLWRRGARDSCYDLYLKVSKESVERLTNLSSLPFVASFKEGLDAVMVACAKGTSKEKDKGAVSLRKILDKLLVDCEQEKAKGGKVSAVAVSSEASMSSPEARALLAELQTLNEADSGVEIKDGASSVMRRAKAAEAQVEVLKTQLADMIKAGPGATPAGISTQVPAQQAAGTTRARAAAAAAVGVSPMELKKLQKKCKDLEEQLAKGGGVDKKALETVEKKYSKQIKDMEAATKKNSKALEDKLAKLTTDHAGAAEKIDTLTADLASHKIKVKEMTGLLSEMESLKSKASQLVELKEQLDSLQTQYAVLGEQFKKENALRKKYKNELEDLKGAIRVYARCRPMAGYEIEKGCQTIVKFTDDTSLKVMSSRGEKEFEFDAAFTMNSTQEEVFEDTRRLVESCLDGYNVCLFAYGQTGSGKTHTMTGSPALPGLTPRAIDEIFLLISQRKHCKSTVSTYFVELYNDNLVDLYWILDNTKNKKKGAAANPEGPPKLEIRMDAKNMVFIRNSVIKEVGSPAELMDLFNAGNAERHTGATKMNAVSSRSHSIFAIMVETVDSVTKKTITGKMSLVDLAGSERQDKTGATADRLKEAMNINKSLSALGDVIAALSEGEKFIPYRNNKLTQLMQDSLGGNAKTLMFVNFSPADYNADETSSSLQYAARVKKIVNNASKQAESEEVTRLKAIIRKLQGGGTVAPDDIESIAQDAPMPEPVGEPSQDGQDNGGQPPNEEQG